MGATTVGGTSTLEGGRIVVGTAEGTTGGAGGGGAANAAGGVVGDGGAPAPAASLLAARYLCCSSISCLWWADSALSADSWEVRSAWAGAVALPGLPGVGTALSPPVAAE